MQYKDQTTLLLPVSGGKIASNNGRGDLGSKTTSSYAPTEDERREAIKSIMEDLKRAGLLKSSSQ